jgi:hypothetical protein
MERRFEFMRAPGGLQVFELYMAGSTILRVLIRLKLDVLASADGLHTFG